MIAATILLIAMPFVPFALPRGTAAAVGPWIMAACSLGGLTTLTFG